jgi:hypothetical protein
MHGGKKEMKRKKNSFYEGEAINFVDVFQMPTDRTGIKIKVSSPCSSLAPFTMLFLESDATEPFRLSINAQEP